MAARLSEVVEGGELDNTQFGWTIGWIKLRDQPEPLRLKLAGNCHPDLAGWKFQIVRIEEPRDDGPGATNPACYDFLDRDQSGHVGDITADQMLKQFDMPDDEAFERLREGESPPFTLRKSLYLEWFSNANGRIVIQCTRLAVERLGERAFELTAEQYANQLIQNHQEMSYFLTQLDDALGNGEP